MPSPGNPCAPALLAVPNGTSGIPFPLLNAADYIPEPTPAPSYTDITCALISCDENAPDGLDDILTLAGSLADQWDAASAAQDADMDTILATLEATDTSAADQAQNDFVNSFAAGENLVAGVAGITLPDYGSLPTSWVQPGAQPVGPGGAGPNAGTVHAGDPAFTSQYVVGFPLNTLFGAPDHAQLAGGVVAGAAPVFVSASMVSAAVAPDGKSYLVTLAVNINPTTAGTFQQSVFIFGRSSGVPERDAIFITILPAAAATS